MMTNGANLVAVEIAYIGAAIIRMIMRAQTGRIHISAAGGERRGEPARSEFAAGFAVER